MSVKQDTQELIQEVFTCDLEGVTQELTYHSIDKMQTYDPETGEFTGVPGGGGGTGGPLFGSPANSHWLGII